MFNMSVRPEFDYPWILLAMRPVSRCLIAVASLQLMGCGMGYAIGTREAKPLVMHHAEIDLDCAPDDIRVEEAWGGRWEAIGCGRKALYNARCDGIACQVLPEDEGVPSKDRPLPE